MNKTFSFLLILLTFSIVASGCGARKQLQANVSLEEFENDTASVTDVSNNGKFTQNSFASAKPAPVGTNVNDYVLGAGDLISVNVYEAEELNCETRISSRGVITLPLLKKIHVQGLTAIEAEEKIEAALLKDYMHEAHVTLFVKERVSQRITLVGAIHNPGTYETQATKRILEILAIGGGMTTSAGDTVYVTRQKKDGEGNEVFLVDMEELLKNGRVEMNMFIQGGDVIFVPQSNMVQVDGAVWHPGAVEIDGDLTIDEAIAAAGGLAQYADDEDIKLIRKGQDGKRKIIQLSMVDILAMKEEKNADIKNGPWKELLLRNGDVIFAEASGTRSFYSGVGFSIGFMGTGLTYRNPVQYRSQIIRNSPNTK